MKLLVGLLLMVSFSSILTARNIYNIKYQHPRSEPNGLYIVGFNYNTNSNYFQYRVYCPTGDIRNITDGRWGKARKAFQEDRIRFNNRRVVREAVDYVCGY
jgi:hypothetical protein